MSTKQSTVDFILEQLETLGNVHARKMFGEYALYFNNKVVGLICNDTLFVKITPEGKKFADKFYIEGIPYPKAKLSMQIDDELIDDQEWICKLVEITASNLPKK